MAPLLLAGLLLRPLAPVEAPRLRLPAVVFVAAQGADIATSCYAFSTGRFVERNNLLSSNCARVTITKTVYTAATLWIHGRIAKTHPKVARYSLWIAAGLSTVPVLWNLHQIRR